MNATRMKPCLKALCAIAIAAMACLTTYNSLADTLFAWTITNTAGYGISPLPATTVNPNLNVGALARGPGVDTGGTAAAFSWGAEGWSTSTVKATAITAGSYFTFSFTANPGYTTTLTNIQIFNSRRNTNNGPTNVVMQFSTNGGSTFTDFKTNNYLATTATTNLATTLTNVVGLSNIPPGTTVLFRVVAFGAANASAAFYITDPTTGSNDLELRGTLVSSGVAPTNVFLSPASTTANFGSTVKFSVVAGGDNATNYVYQVVGGVTNLVATTATNGFTLSSITTASAGQYFVVLSNVFGLGTSGPVTLSVIDPAVSVPPNSTYGLLGQSARFSVTAAGTALTYQWYFAQTNGTVTGPVVNGPNSYSASGNSGATTSLLTVTNLTASDLTNYIVVISGTFGSYTSPVVSIVSVGTTVPIAFWNFNGTNFTNTLASPAPYYGVGTAFGVNTAPFSGSLDGNDGAGLNPPFGLGGPPYFSWGVTPSPAQGISNKLLGVQFNTSTVGARNITVSYDGRVTATASMYHRFQYTTNGTTWTDYPISSTYGVPKTIDSTITTAGQGYVLPTSYTASTFGSFNYINFSGFPGVDNNPLFGIRVVSETENTATYGASPNTNYYGDNNTYGTGGTVTYDLFTITGTTITNFSAPPTIGPIPNTNVIDFGATVTVPVPVGDTVNNPSTLVLSATSIGVPPNPLGPLGLSSSQFTFGGSGTARTMTITPQVDGDGVGAIEVTATDPATGLSAVTWFYLTVAPLNLAPTNSLVGTLGTNTLANKSVSLPFTASDDHTAAASLTYSGASSNNTVLPSGNITFNTAAAGAPIATMTPANNQLGAVPVLITVNDNDPTEPRSTTANITLEVRPNTNIVLIDYFNYDAVGSLANISPSLWTHLSGGAGQMQVGVGGMPGYALVDTFNNTENLHAGFITNQTFLTNSAAVVFASLVMNMSPSSMPRSNGTYFACLQDGSNVSTNANATQDVGCRIMVATNGAAPGDYRVGISNGGTDSTAAQMLPIDLVPGQDYTVVVREVVSNNFSTLWLNPSSITSSNVLDTTTASPLYNVGAFELRESGANAGAVSVARLKVGTTFDSVLPSLKITQTNNATVVVLTSSDPTLPVEGASVVTGPFSQLSTGTPFTNSIGTNLSKFYRLGPPSIGGGN